MESGVWCYCRGMGGNNYLQKLKYCTRFPCVAFQLCLYLFFHSLVIWFVNG